jgi:hypothetical protein
MASLSHRRPFSISTGHCMSFAALPTSKPFIGANATAPVAPGEQASNRSAGEMFICWRLPWHIPNATDAQ